MLIWKTLTKLLYSNQYPDTSIKSRHIDQSNKINSPENEPSHVWSNNVWQGCQGISMKKGQYFPQMLLENWTSTGKRMKLDVYLTPCIKLTQDGSKTQM